MLKWSSFYQLLSYVYFKMFALFYKTTETALFRVCVKMIKLYKKYIGNYVITLKVLIWYAVKERLSDQF